jgi:RimJ/RimL family protein N-acetyltransferase
MTIPTLETERLLLRAHRVDDFEPLAAMWADPEVARFIGGQPSKRDDSWARLLRYAGHWQLMGFGFWAVELKAEPGLIGDVGFADWKRDLDSPLAGLPEAGWVFSPAVHGRGLASEAVAAALAWGDQHFGSRPSCCMVDVQNLASIRLAHKCGYTEFARTEFKGSPVIQFRRY